MGSGGSKKSAEKATEQQEAKPAAAEAKDAKPAEAAPAAAAGSAPAAAPAAAPADVPPEDAPYKLQDPPEGFVVEGLRLAGGAVSDHADVQQGKVLQVAKHPEEMFMQYWLKVEYGSGKIAFVHTLMSCGWNSDKVIRDVGDAQFPPDPKNLPVGGETGPAAAPADPAALEVPGDDVVYTIQDPPEDFVVQGLPPCGGIVADRDDVRQGKVLQVAKHPSESRMQYWLKVEYGSSQVALVHMLMSCGWTSDKLLLDVGDVAFPVDPKNLPSSKEGKPLPDLKPADYMQEFVDPSHLEAIETNASLKSVFPEASAGQVKSIWRGPTGFWLEVEGEGCRYGAHFLQEEGEVLAEGQQYVISCAVKLAEDEEFPPEPRSTRGTAVAF